MSRGTLLTGKIVLHNGRQSRFNKRSRTSPFSSDVRCHVIENSAVEVGETANGVPRMQCSCTMQLCWVMADTLLG